MKSVTHYTDTQGNHGDNMLHEECPSNEVVSTLLMTQLQSPLDEAIQHACAMIHTDTQHMPAIILQFKRLIQALIMDTSDPGLVKVSTVG